MSEPIRVLVTGAAGQIAYSLLYSLAKGDVFGDKQEIDLVLLDIPAMMHVLKGVEMELQDCALPLVKEIILTADEAEAFKDIDVAILVGAMPRREGMERKDLLEANVKIFKAQGKALNDHAKKTCKVVVVGNPANTNAFIAKKFAPSLPSNNFTCLTRLDQNRAQAQIASKVDVSTTAVRNVIIWGNHSSTQFPDVEHATVVNKTGTISVYEAVKDDSWLKNKFIETVQKRGGDVIKARKLSSAMSAAKAICDHVRDLWGVEQSSTDDSIQKVENKKWVSMGVPSDGSYGIEKGLIYSFPVSIQSNGRYEIVQDLPISNFARAKMDATMAELVEEREMALKACGE